MATDLADTAGVKFASVHFGALRELRIEFDTPHA
jgi:hypothetical protein